ncbi:MAG: class I SAM-dependent methyltransferase [Acidimicrobiales bacterium]
MTGRAHPAADPATAATWEALRDQTAPAAFTAAVADLLAGHLDPSRPVVDVGAGSGHLAAALAGRGLHVVALDLSLPMLARVPVGLIRVAADASALPVRGRGVGAALVAHLLHVVPDWPAAVSELDRVVGPDGVVLVQAGASSGITGALAPLRQAFADHLPPRALVGNAVAADPLVLDRAFAALGRAGVDLPEVRVPRWETARGVLRWLQGNPWTWPGPTIDAERAAGAEAAMAFAAAQGIDLDEPFMTASVNRWRSYAQPASSAKAQKARQGA